jgi:uncharacterized protein (TIGR02996 family)
VTDDEAFIRRIVDSPGDDTPRMVYADWLDERNDPRGAYLRAEAATPGLVERLAPLARGLDPVWVARVSRPPVGVCCDRSVFSDSSPQLSDQDVSRFELETGLPLSGDYRAFLLNTNGGVPSTRVSWAASGGWSFPDQCFFSLEVDGQLPGRRSLLDHVLRFRSLLPDLLTVELWDAGPDDVPWQADALPIGDTGRDFTLFYAVRGKYAGRLHLHDYTGDWCAFGSHAGPHGPPTLPEFLYRLIEHGQTLPDTYPSQPLQEFWKS